MDNNLNDLTNWDITTWGIAMAAAIIGGIVNWSNKIAMGLIKKFSFVELLGEMFLSGFIGVTVFITLAGMDKNIMICSAASGISGHFATRITFHIGRWLDAKADAVINELDK